MQRFLLSSCSVSRDGRTARSPRSSSRRSWAPRSAPPRRCPSRSRASPTWISRRTGPPAPGSTPGTTAGGIGVWKGNRGWLLDFTHHKVYLTNRPARGPEVPDHQRHEPVHPEPRLPPRPALVRLRRGTGGHLPHQQGARAEARERPRVSRADTSCPAGRSWAARPAGFPRRPGFFLSLDGRVSRPTSACRWPAATPSVPNLALHFHVGLGFRVRSGR